MIVELSRAPDVPLAMSRSRRSFLASSVVAVSAPLAAAVRSQSPDEAPAAASRDRPILPFGVQSGDAGDGAAIVWAACDRPSRLLVEWTTTERPHHTRIVEGPVALPETGGTARVLIDGLPPGADVVYRALFRDLESMRSVSDPAAGRLRTPAASTGRSWSPMDRPDATPGRSSIGLIAIVSKSCWKSTSPASISGSRRTRHTA